MSMPYILVVYYSRYGKTKDLAYKIAEGVINVDAIEVKVRTVPEVASLTETPSSPAEQTELYVTEDELKNCAGLIIGSPTYFGNMAAAMKHFFDSTSDLWMTGALINKPAGVFTSTGGMHAGQEATLLSMMLPLLHHGALITGIPYSCKALHSTTTGGGPYGASHHAGGVIANPISKDEADVCKTLGETIAKLAKRLQS
ncbi:NAD(P)H:quinone oxidoreductase [Thiotrichales bacterium 19S3-7]|nr:NAD(P)H:quinone oxidoreductase [Thiotrichales bacterium 19S3-7]MCF6800607.1 NAD(P)H:quinone oxidoreductase [Thiotrichales bacterium 19S3-11]